MIYGIFAVAFLILGFYLLSIVKKQEKKWIAYVIKVFGITCVTFGVISLYFIIKGEF